MPTATELAPRETAKRPAQADPHAALRAVRAEKARRHHIDFMRQAWQKPGEPFLVGIHTRAICAMIDEAIERYRKGESSFLAVMVPFRHGKSDLISRYLPPKFLAEFPDGEVLLVTYGAELAMDLSRFARRIIQSPAYAQLFGSRVAADSSAVDRWGIEGHTGGMMAQGFGGAMVGRGYHLGIVDDYLRSRADAESVTVRDRIWDAFTNDFLTRRAPVSITIVLATPWHVDDLLGRLRKAQTDPAFPQFHFVRFAAFDESYPSGTLFPERFPLAWYEQQRASLGQYGTAALLQCSPVQRSGNLLKTDRVKVIEPADIPEGLRFVRFWDPASTVKDVMKPDPDWTVGLKMAVRMIKNEEGASVPQVIIAHVRRGRWEAPERERIQKQVAELDGPGVRIGIEAAGGYKDSYTRLKAVLLGVRNVEPIYPATDKLIRAEPLAPIFEAGNVLLVRGEWNQEYLDELADFPSGTHDDQVDGTSGAWGMISASNYVGAL